MVMDDKIFNFCYDMALRDATVRNAFTSPISEIKEIGDIREKVKEYIDKIINRCEYDTLKTIKSIVDCKAVEVYNNTKNYKCEKIKFGNVQKLVNMTAKYVYIAVYYDEGLRSRFSKCHCPIDGIILGKTYENISENFDTEDDFKKIYEWNNKINGDENIKRKTVYTLLRNVGFSTITVDEYVLCQDIIKYLVDKDYDINNAIEYDYKYYEL